MLCSYYNNNNNNKEGRKKLLEMTDVFMTGGGFVDIYLSPNLPSFIYKFAQIFVCQSHLNKVI